MAVSHLLLALAASAAGVVTAVSNGNSTTRNFTAKGIATGTTAQLQTSPFAPFSLSPEIPLATLDYGAERAGYPTFEVSAISAPVQIEVKYTEHFDGLNHPFDDGPYTFSNQLSNSFRVETFNITSISRVTSPLIQGGQKWQSIRLLTNGTVSFSSVGFEATIDTLEPEELPGQFESDDEILNEVWKLGARAATAACFDKGTQKTIWEVTEENRVFARSTRPSMTYKATKWSNYTLEFDTKLERGGSWWVTGGVIAGNGYTMLLTGELPESSTFVNVNKTLTPPNTISYLLDVFDVPFTVKENDWYRIKASMAPTGYLAVSINDTQILNISRSDYPWALSSGTVSYSGSPDFSGSFGFGAYQDQAAYFRNVHVYDTANGTMLYSNTLTGSSEDVIADYGTQANSEAACLDGPKRDRLIWLGDFYHTARIIAASTSKMEQARGTLQLLLDSQIANGQMNMSPTLGYNLASVANELAAPAGRFGLQDYQLLGLIVELGALTLMAFNDHVRLTNDLDWAHQLTTGLLTFDGGFAFTGPADGGSAIGCEAVQTLNGAADVADALNDTVSATQYRDAATSLATAINERLWNEEAGAYGLSPADLDGISVAATAFCITSGVANATRASRSLAAVSGLKLGPGYKDNSAVSSNDSSVNISPNTNGFLLEALFVGNETQAARELMESLWGAMLPGDTTAAQNRSAVGARWEYVNAATRQPGLGLFTSLSHPWGGAATYVLTEWAAGLRAAAGVDGFGYKNCVVSPATGVEMGLKRASAKVVTAFEGELSVEWIVRDGDIGITIRAPIGTRGQFVYGNKSIALHGRSEYQYTVDASLDNGIA
ncbi:Six-hairpin glycosidase-like protein [Colletotrichum phormii]|uniref:Six-hairpin glycosidase-like protein n=1 Tax=Colletotrichum phormii TaxID=359342 RepID=A0AAJ0EDG8_9PEZI|nr:Six-hairpin glycosidase-like protein [Colletotrichum phormii]KAK1635887.1 Six-hairpin glycosidase-like protein [Colletotrichum phormii]